MRGLTRLTVTSESEHSTTHPPAALAWVHRGPGRRFNHLGGGTGAPARHCHTRSSPGQSPSTHAPAREAVGAEISWPLSTTPMRSLGCRSPPTPRSR